MKKSSIFLLMALVAASCARDNDFSETGGQTAQKSNYLKLAVNLPSSNQAALRAANDDYDDGTANEYAVNDATLILFEGESEATAKISTAYDLNLSFGTVTPDDDNITTSAQIIQKINDALEGSNKFYALVILNDNGLFNVVSDSLYFGGQKCSNKTLKEFVRDTKISLSDKSILKGAGTEANQFLMSNAPLFTKPGGGQDPAGGKLVILSEIDKDDIYETEAEAAANPATEIYVERAASKVTLAVKSGLNKTANELSFEILGWQLDNTNTETYLVRNDTSFADWQSLYSLKDGIANKYRFVGHTAVATGLYRTYWAEDPNYTGKNDGGVTGGVTYWDETTSGITWLPAGEGIAYCAENTFDVAHQNDINTTTAIIKAQFNNGVTFYTINNNSKTFYDKTGVVKAVKAYFLGNDAVRGALESKIKSGATLGEDDLTVTFAVADDNVAGIIRINEITINKEKIKDATSDLKASEIMLENISALTLVNEYNVIRRYIKGVAYYPIHIKHFGDDLTPWRNGEGSGDDAPKAGNIYPAAHRDANYLGRYGMLRNNWYDILVTSVKNLGTATVPTLGNTAGPTDDPEGPGNGNCDDDIDEYISVKINILSWAKRTQSVDL